VSPVHLLLAMRFVPAEDLHWVPRSELRGLPLGKRDQRLRDLLETPGQVPLMAPDRDSLIKTLSTQP
jgi:hypothetical protein